MQNQRLLYSQSKRNNNRSFSINKENNNKVFSNDSLLDDTTGLANKPTTTTVGLRYDYDNNVRMSMGRAGGNNNSVIKTVSNQYLSNRLRERPVGVMASSDLIDCEKLTQRKQQSPLVQITSQMHNNNRSVSPLKPQPKIITTSSEQQLQSYANKLLENNELYQQQIFELKKQLTKLRQQHQKSLADNIKFKISVEKNQQETKLKFNEQISNLVKQLKEILVAKQQMQQQYNKYIGQLIQEHTAQLQKRQQSFLKAQQFFKQKLLSLKTNLSLTNQQKQKSYFEASESKLKLIKQIDQLNFNLQKEKQSKRQLQKTNQQMLKIVKQLELQLKQKKQKLQNAQVQVFRIQKQKNQIIIELKTKNNQLTQQIKILSSKITQLNNLFNNKQTQLNKLQNQHKKSTTQLDQKTKQLLKLKYQTEQFKQQTHNQAQTMLKQINNLNTQNQYFQKLVNQLQTTIKSLLQDLKVKDTQLQTTNKQLASITIQLQTLKKSEQKLTQQMGQLQEINKKYKRDNVQFLQQLQILTLQSKSLKQDKLLKQNQLKTLQQLCQQLQKSRQKAKQQQTQKQNHKQRAMIIEQRQTTTDKPIDYSEIQKLIERKYEKQIMSLYQQNSQLREQIELIVNQYEHKLKQKQQKWKQRVQNIQKELQGLMIINKNNSLIYKTDSQSPNKQTQQQPQNEYMLNQWQQQLSIQKERINKPSLERSVRKQLKSPVIIKNTAFNNYHQHQQKQKPTINQNQLLQSLNKRDTIRQKYFTNSQSINNNNNNNNNNNYNNNNNDNNNNNNNNYTNNKTYNLLKSSPSTVKPSLKQQQQLLSNDENFNFRKRQNTKFYQQVQNRFTEFRNSRNSFY